ncbi:MAG: hypothetical protein Q8Q31_00950 [Nanoarchaeota archaeon]|nr:hypothetical protein [Nanoarchaeota archaeon]
MKKPLIKDPDLRTAINEADINFKGPSLRGIREKQQALDKAREWYWEQARRLERYHEKASDETLGPKIGHLLENQYSNIKSVINDQFRDSVKERRHY